MFLPLDTKLCPLTSTVFSARFFSNTILILLFLCGLCCSISCVALELDVPPFTVSETGVKSLAIFDLVIYFGNYFFSFSCALFFFFLKISLFFWCWSLPGRESGRAQLTVACYDDTLLVIVPTRERIRKLLVPVREQNLLFDNS